jgi:hypothetical protein
MGEGILKYINTHIAFIQNMYVKAVAFRREANLFPCNVQSLLNVPSLILDLYLQ